MNKKEQRLKDIKEKLKPRIQRAILLKDVNHPEGIIRKGAQGIIVDEFSSNELCLGEMVDTFYPRFLQAKNQGAWLILFGDRIVSVPATQVDFIKEGPCMENGDAEFLLDCIMGRSA